MKTILCNEELKPVLYHRLLKEARTPAMTGVSLRSPANLLDDVICSEGTVTLLFLSQLLQKEQERFPIYREMFVYPAFIEEILSFARRCAMYSITPQELPRSTAGEKELAELIAIALSLPLKEKEYPAARKEVLEHAAKYSPLKDELRFEADPFLSELTESLKKLVPDAETDQEVRTPSFEELRFAPSVRKEIEACAQEIIRRDEPCAVVLCSPDSQLPVLRQVFSRYGIPCSAVHAAVRPVLLDIYVSLARLAMNKDKASLLDCLSCDAFAAACSGPLFDWLSAVLRGPEYSEVAGRIPEGCFEYEKKRAERMDEAAKRYYERIRRALDILLAAPAPFEALFAAYSVMSVNPILNDSVQLQCGMKIRRLLNESLPLVQTEADAQFVLRQIEAMHLSASEAPDPFCQVTDLSHPILPVPSIYVLGCTARAYPGVPLCKGVFDEAYVARIPAYPSLEMRHALWNDQIRWLCRSSDRLIWSVPSNDYQGREIQPAFELTSRFPNMQAWQLDQVAPAHLERNLLSEETAEQLYPADDGAIHSSISRIERWFACPFSWFIESGLKIRKPQPAGFDAASFGTLQHSVFEHTVEAYGKQYANASEKEIRKQLKPAFDALRALYPDDAVKADLSEERMCDQLALTLQFLKETEAIAPSWAPWKTEAKFSDPIGGSVLLNGIIDRIDCSGNALRILDYKSSHKTLSENHVKAGLQLQLLSYLIVASRKTGFSPIGAYYISMKSEAANCPAGSFGKTNRNGVPMNDCSDPAVLHDLWIKARQLAGWSFDDPLISTEDYKAYFTPSRDRYSYELTEQCIEELYELFSQGVLSGDIRILPKTGACMFCDYRAVCRNHMPEEAIVPLVMSDTSLKLKKGEA
ncbi:MAG: PD-(D/E)XK nuclease family protein [Solobacterium sp.]|nr:PD-(D/E)XK nuclease family protein [Solobacterium sp.]